MQVLRPHEAAVHRDRLARPAALGEAGKRGVAGDLERPRLVLDLAQRAGLGDAVDLGEALQEIPGLGQGEVVPARLRQAESHLGWATARWVTDLHYRRPLGPGALEEGPAGGDVVEEAVDEDGRPLGVGGGGDLGLGAALDRDLRGGALARRGGQAEGGDARHRGEGLAPEPQGGHGLDVLDGLDLARRVPQDREAGVLGGHARAVVADQDAARCRRRRARPPRGRPRRPGRSRPAP